MIFNLERAIRLLPPDVDGVTWIVDCSGFSLGWMAPARIKLAADLGMLSCYLMLKEKY